MPLGLGRMGVPTVIALGRAIELTVPVAAVVRGVLWGVGRSLTAGQASCQVPCRWVRPRVRSRRRLRAARRWWSQALFLAMPR